MFRATLSAGLICCALLLLGSCGGGGGGGSTADESPGETPSVPVQTGPSFEDLKPTRMELVVLAGGSRDTFFTFHNGGVQNLTYQASADGWVDLHIGSGRVDPGALGRVDLTARCDDRDVSSEIRISTNDPAREQVVLPVDIECKVPEEGVGRVTFNQGARGFDSIYSSEQSIDLVPGRDAFVRAWVLGEGRAPGGQAVIRTSEDEEIVLEMEQPVELHANLSHPDFRHESYNVVIPGSAVNRGATLQLEFFPPEGEPLRFPADGPMTLSVAHLRAFEVTFVPITFEGETPEVDVDAFARAAIDVLPVGQFDLDVRDPYTFTGSWNMERMLDDIAELRELDGSSRLYHGMVPPPAEGQAEPGGSPIADFRQVSDLHSATIRRFMKLATISICGMRRAVTHPIRILSIPMMVDGSVCTGTA